MGTALIPGSYDPMTLGHLDIITRAAAKFDRVVVAVMTNDMHKYVAGVTPKVYLFDETERTHMARLTCAHLPNVEVISATGRLIDLVDRVGADLIVKGVRNEADFAYEQTHALYNRAHNPRAETVYLPADPSFDGVSSTLARQMLREGQDLSGILAPEVIQWINTHPRD
ncbi:MAG: pantetheine-phosphate adenylyltransferase [Ruminococcaceae bacterium]|nr:pantetheine-phosphate adenylyltransferase [Oscillospiraceae bacterium]